MHKNFLYLVLISMLYLFCNTDSPSTSSNSQTLRKELRYQEDIAFPSIEKWEQLNNRTHFLVSPKWILNGSKIVARGKGGRGIYMIDPDTKSTEIILRDYYGLLKIESNQLCVESINKMPGIGNPIRLLEKGFEIVKDLDCYVYILDEKYGTLEYKSERFELWRNMQKGSLTLKLPNGNEKIIEKLDGWGIEVSTKADKILYSRGALSMNPELIIYFVEDGSSISLPGGVYGIWLPGDRYILYSKIEGSITEGNISRPLKSDFYIYDVATQKESKLYTTTDIIEMEPALSPDGSKIIFSDWKNGILYLISLGRMKQ